MGWVLDAAEGCERVIGEGGHAGVGETRAQSK